MTDTNTATVTPETVEAENNKPKLEKIDKGIYVLEEKRFSGNLEGLGYYLLQYKTETDETAAASLKAITERWNAKQIVGIINSAMTSALRVKAQQKILSLDKEKQPQAIVKALRETPILLTQEDAEKWVPGERDLTLQGLMRKVAALTSEGKHLEAMELMQQAQVMLTEKINEENEADADETTKATA